MDLVDDNKFVVNAFLNEYSEPIAFICNKSFLIGVFPEGIKKVSVTPINNIGGIYSS